MAMNYLGQKNVDFKILEKIEQVIHNREFKRLLHSYKYMPLWMISLCKKYEGRSAV
ncbi:MAG TPA: hypothetical protein VKR58_13745 [Aquella sp.]|nr:hypothetical protein [Aquella sp.]